MDQARYFWPSYLFPAISASQDQPHRLEPEAVPPAIASCSSRPPHSILTDVADEEAFASTGLVLKAVCFDLRLIILDLTTCFLEVFPHSLFSRYLETEIILD